VTHARPSEAEGRSSETNGGAGEAALHCLVADAQPVVRAGVVALLQRVVGPVEATMAGGVGELADGLADEGLDLVVTDVVLPGYSGADLVRFVVSRRSAAAVLVFSAQDEALYAERALREGADGYVSKFANEETFSEAVRSVLAGRVYVSESAQRRILEGLAQGSRRSGVEQLSAREHEVFVLLGQGRTRSEIAEQLDVSPRTVGTYLARTAKKLNLRGAARVVEAAVRWVSAGRVTAERGADGADSRTVSV
jgi:DNA-binding NarL/FixJ family response regulator